MTKKFLVFLLVCAAASAAQAQSSLSSLSGLSGQSSSGSGGSGMCSGGSGNCGDSSGSNGQQGDQSDNISISNPAAQQTRRFNRTLNGSLFNGFDKSNPTATRPVPLITEKTDFQLYAEEAAGRTLSIYGRDLFDQGPSTFSVLDRVPVPADYVIGPDDELHVEIWGKIDADVRVVVDRNGQIFLPRIGALGVAGLRYSQLDSYIRDAVSKTFRGFDLNVTLGKLRSIQVYVLGSARQPGAYTVSALSTLIDTLFVSGGPSVSGSMRAIELRRGGQTVATLDLYDVLRRGDKTHDVKLQPGDIIYIAPVGPQVAVVGNIHDPGIYELKGDLSVAAALENAGGLSAMASTGRAVLERIEDRKMHQTEEISLDQLGVHRKMRDGDLLRVDSISPQFAGTVMLRGSVAVPGRYAWHEGMRVSDLIPTREALIRRDHWIQQNHLVESQQNRLDEQQKSLQNQAQLGDQAMISSAVTMASTPSGQTQLAMQPPLVLPTALLNAAQAVLNPANMQPVAPQTTGSGSSSAQSQTTMSPLAGVVSTGANSVQALAPVQNGQTIGLSSMPGQSAAALVPQPGASPAGAQPSAASGQLQNPAPGTTPLDLLADLSQTSTEINWDYAVIERLDKTDLSARLIPFKLGEAISNPASEANQPLLAGDVITILGRKDIALPTEKRARFVQVHGEVASPGVYRIEPGETLRDLIKRAGGLGRHSYLYGMQVNRQSVRIQQQMQLAQSIAQMQKQISAQLSTGSQQMAALGQGASAANNINSAEAIGQRQTLDLEQKMLDRLLTVEATGRVVLSIRPTAGTVDDVPEFHLEDGDSVLIPSRMDTVQVMGEVFGENTLRFQAGRHLSEYLGQAGGATTTGDLAHAFLIRADGTVVGRKQQSHAWKGNFNSIVLAPGDAIVVPPRVRIPNYALNEFLEITSVLAQTAITAAVVKNVL